MVYWVINYGPVCPTGWNQAALNCWIASSAVSVPHQKVSALGDLQLSGTVVSGGNDTVAQSVDCGHLSDDQYRQRAGRLLRHRDTPRNGQRSGCW